MSQPNVEVVRRAYECFNRRDLAGAVAALDRNAEWMPYLAALEVEFRGMGKASGADIRTAIFQAFSFRDGKVTRVQGFRTAAEALEAVKLR